MPVASPKKSDGASPSSACIDCPKITEDSTATAPTDRSTKPDSTSMAPGTATMPTTATCSRMTEAFCEVKKRSLASEKKAIIAASAKNRPLRWAQASNGQLIRIAGASLPGIGPALARHWSEGGARRPQPRSTSSAARPQIRTCTPPAGDRSSRCRYPR
jgi:hypothetical protein